VEIEEGVRWIDFSVILLILDDNKGEVARVGVFRKDLGFKFNDLKEDEIDNEMIKLHMKRMTIECENDERNECYRAVLVKKDDFESPVEEDN
jgi:hypothetical protein